MIGRFAVLLALGGGALATVLIARHSRADRSWAPDHARMPIVTVTDSIVRIDNVRRFRYPAAGPVQESWESRSYDLRDLIGRRLGLIDATGPADSVRARYRIDPRARSYLASPDFSQRIRQ